MLKKDSIDNKVKIAFIVFNGITWLDFIGVYDPITRLKTMNYLPELSWDICSYTETVADNFGLEMKPTKSKNSLSNYDAIIIPGGFGTRQLIADAECLDWIKTAEKVQYKIAVCTGSLVLGAAGFLKDKMATTHFDEYETLQPFCKEAKKERIVADGNIITAGAVASSLDLGLYLCELWANEAAATVIRKRMDYHG